LPGILLGNVRPATGDLIQLTQQTDYMKQRYHVFILGLLLVLASVSAYAQRTVSGTVSDTQGTPMPGVNVIVKGTSSGTTTDSNGRYTVDLGNGTVLVFSFIGYMTQEVEVGARSTVDVTLSEDVRQLSEVVVTALGIEREVKALNYSVSEVKGDEFVQARENNLAAQLSGRVAGVNVSKASSGPAGSTRVVIRGNKTLSGGNPLYVIDGIPMDNSNFGQAGLWGGRDEGDGLTSINPDDIESITVLKGASAAALYGGRAGFGVINITTKKGAARRGLGIEFNSNYVFETVNDLRDLQHSFGAGNFVGDTPSKPTTLQQAFNWGSSHWGPRLDGTPVLQFDGVERPYSYVGDNWDKFFETGHAWTNSIALTGGGENQTFRFSVSDLRSTTVLPNSGFDRTNVTMSTNSKFGERLTLDAKMMYSHEYAHNRPVLSDSPGNAVQSMWIIPNNVDVNIYRGDPNKPGAIPQNISDELLVIYGQGGDPRMPGQEWLPAANNWGQNPYWATYQFIDDDTRDRIIGSAALRYDITDFLWVSGRIGLDWFTRRSTSLTPEGTGYQLGGALTEGESRAKEINMEWMLGFDKEFGKISVNAFVGGNRMRRDREDINANGSGFNVPFFPAINNTASRNFGYGFNESGINSLFGSAEIGYNGVLFLTATGRQDWFSVLNPEYNHQFYPSVGASFVFSDAFTGLPS
jgi:TonB-linked SusC/RagA family outer membrane protein